MHVYGDLWGARLPLPCRAISGTDHRPRPAAPKIGGSVYCIISRAIQSKKLRFRAAAASLPAPVCGKIHPAPHAIAGMSVPWPEIIIYKDNQVVHYGT